MDVGGEGCVTGRMVSVVRGIDQKANRAVGELGYLLLYDAPHARSYSCVNDERGFRPEHYADVVARHGLGQEREDASPSSKGTMRIPVGARFGLPYSSGRASISPVR